MRDFFLFGCTEPVKKLGSLYKFEKQKTKSSVRHYVEIIISTSVFGFNHLRANISLYEHFIYNGKTKKWKAEERVKIS